MDRRGFLQALGLVVGGTLIPRRAYSFANELRVPGAEYFDVFVDDVFVKSVPETPHVFVQVAHGSWKRVSVRGRRSQFETLVRFGNDANVFVEYLQTQRALDRPEGAARLPNVMIGSGAFDLRFFNTAKRIEMVSHFEGQSTLYIPGVEPTPPCV